VRVGLAWSLDADFDAPRQSIEKLDERQNALAGKAAIQARFAQQLLFGKNCAGCREAASQS
jgi:hypothetical protein